MSDALKWQSFYATTKDGLRLHIQKIGEASSTQLPIFCLHGLSRNGDDFYAIGAALAQTGRMVYALDSRGRGGSSYDLDWHHYDLATELTDLIEVFQQLNLKNAIFFGTSRGGMLMMLLSILRPEWLAGAILNDIGPVIEIAGLQRIQSYVGKLGIPTDFIAGAKQLRRIFHVQFPQITEGAWLRFAKRTWREEQGQLILRYDSNIMKPFAKIDFTQAAVDLWGAFNGLNSCPLMVIRGELSDILSQQTAEEMVKRHPNAQLHVVAQEGHAPLLEDEVTIEAICQFVAKLG